MEDPQNTREISWHYENLLKDLDNLKTTEKYYLDYIKSKSDYIVIPDPDKLADAISLQVLMNKILYRIYSVMKKEVKLDEERSNDLTEEDPREPAGMMRM